MESWRAIVAALANDAARVAYARIVAGDPARAFDGLSPSRRRHVVDTLLGAGLIARDGDSWTADGEPFRTALRDAPAPARATGPERFLDAHGRITQYPANKTTRGELLALVAERALRPDEVLTERELNARLGAFTDDVAVLRRYLVDYELLERTPSGSEYARTR
ncbi:DUF2087 domain-containing protein [Microbacterium sp. Marseille-Q6965]|uniref:DUF2087 domain-containing protein n=1 Tax=Microbacterium sp. Marseille-Q6965 TaxID=2965072 RepID=UPI0021B7E60E|nr:DUF2087 domain-containing protein [Microbacterium sp. Marseille-Q6965]